MIKRSTIHFLIALLFGSALFSCNGEVKRKLFNIKKTYPPSLIRNHLLFSDLSNEYSFPIWFSDSLIALNKISKITRIIYPKSLTEASQGDSTAVVPSETVEYLFLTNGSIEKIVRAFYFDDRKISEFEFIYTNEKGDKGKDGFAKVRYNQDSQINNKYTVSDVYTLYDRKKQQDRYIEFENRITGDYLYFIPEKKNWGPVDIDRTIRPNPQDILVLGNSLTPNKIYQVRNKVNETNVVEFEYMKGSIKNIRTNDYPFHSKRSFTYDKRGYCIGFIDSTFSENSFLTRTISDFENNMFFSPTKIYHRKENSEGKLTLINSEEFVYEFRK
jgi:hypothetical protein|tara:strand:+ start:27268 stop:28254 length:987 start_codon:yes stop_codon:yes gene_type:complete